MAFIGIRRVSNSAKDGTTEVSDLIMELSKSEQEYQSPNEQYKRLYCGGILSFLCANLWTLQQLSCCKIHNIYFAFTVSVFKMERKEKITSRRTCISRKIKKNMDS
jgi:hypothetical protein